MFVNKYMDETTMSNDTQCCEMGNPCMMNDPCQPIMECPQERVCHHQICHDVRHIVPINTRIINHHIYRHTYQPMYTCCMQDEVCNIYDNNNCF